MHCFVGGAGGGCSVGFAAVLLGLSGALEPLDFFFCL